MINCGPIEPMHCHIGIAAIGRLGRHIGAALLLLAGLLLPGPAASAEPRLLGTWRDWNAFILDEASGPVCWMVSRPKKMEGEFTKRGDVFLMVTHRPAERSFDVVSFVAGFSMPDRSDVMVQVGKQSFKLFSEGEQAWARDDSVDRTIAHALRQGSMVMVRATSLRGTRTTDTFSLAGSGGAYQAIAEACAEGAGATP